jgi:hypothetical protein
VSAAPKTRHLISGETVAAAHARARAADDALMGLPGDCTEEQAVAAIDACEAADRGVGDAWAAEREAAGDIISARNIRSASGWWCRRFAPGAEDAR